MLATLRQRNFAFLWAGGLISVFGDWVLIATLPFHVYTLTGSALAASSMLIAYTLPGLLFGSVAGVFVDRWNRKRIMVVADLLRAVLLLLLLAFRSRDWLWVVYVVAFVESAVGQFFGPAKGALIPRLAGESHLVAANSLNALSDNLARLLGPSLGGTLMALMGLPSVVLLDSASYLLSGILIALIAAPPAPQAPPDPATEPARNWARVWREWREGLEVVRREQVIAAIFVVLGMAAIADSFNSALLVPFVNDVLGGGPQDFGWLLTGQAVSGLIAGLLIGHASKVISPGRLIALSAAAAALLFGVAFNFPSLRRIYVIVTLLGFPSVGFYVSTQTLLQSSVADEYRGRVFGALGTTNALLGLSTLGLGGALADRLGVRPVLNVVVALWLFTAAVAWIALRSARSPEPTMASRSETPAVSDRA